MSQRLIRAAAQLRDAVGKLKFAAPVSHVYNPLAYAWDSHEAYIRRYATGSKRVLFLGMNPGPFGMAQTGVPFGEVSAVRDWLGIASEVGQPPKIHPKRPVQGFACLRSEVSGQRLWGLFADRFRTADKFFVDHFVVNYCPLAFIEESGRNRTPDKLPTVEREALFAACNEHLRQVVRELKPEWIIGVGDFAMKRAQEILGDSAQIGRILHPSPASPAANRNWALAATKQLRDLGVW